jgi:hypothetical protein
MITFHWAYIPFAITVLVLFIWGLLLLGTEGLGEGFMGCGLFLVMLIVIAIFGGIFWW